MKKKITFIILILILSGVAFFFVKWYNFSKNENYPTGLKPRLESGVFIIKELSPEEIKMDMILLIKNPLPLALNLDSLTYKIYINQTEVIKSAYPRAISLKGSDSTLLTLPVIVKNKILTDVLKNLDSKNADSANYTIAGKVYLKLPVLRDKFYPFSYTKRGPLIIIPTVTLIKPKLKKLGLRHTQLLLVTKIENPNVFPMDFKRTKYLFTINKDSLCSGAIDSIIRIPAHQSINLTIPVDLNLKEAAETALDFLFKSDNTLYYFYLETKVVSDDNSIKNSKFIVKSKGTLKELKDMR